jgi:hypothetical protein
VKDGGLSTAFHAKIRPAVASRRTTAEARGERAIAASKVPPRILVEGVSCWRIARAGRVAILIDGAAYFQALLAALRQPRWCIVILGWDLDARIGLDRGSRRRSPGRGWSRHRAPEPRPRAMASLSSEPEPEAGRTEPIPGTAVLDPAEPPDRGQLNRPLRAGGAGAEPIARACG